MCWSSGHLKRQVNVCTRACTFLGNSKIIQDLKRSEYFYSRGNGYGLRANRREVTIQEHLGGKTRHFDMEICLNVEPTSMFVSVILVLV